MAMALDKVSILKELKENMTCKKNGHENRRIEFLCLAPKC